MSSTSRQESSNLFVGINDIDDNGQILGQPERDAEYLASRSKSQDITSHRCSRHRHIARLGHDLVVQGLIVEHIIVADENAQQRRIAGGYMKTF